MWELNLIRSKSEKSFLPPACRACPWHELPEDAGSCLNFKKLLCRLEAAAILERFFNSENL